MKNFYKPYNYFSLKKYLTNSRKYGISSSHENQRRENRKRTEATGPNGHGIGEEDWDYPTSILSFFAPK